jgi:hypothetical protein
MPFRRLTRPAVALVGLGIVALLAIGVVAALQLAGQSFGPPARAQSLPCSPQPCLDVENYTLWVSNVTDAGGVLKMTVNFQNSSDATHASPEDLQLVDAKHQTSPAIQDAPGCSQWSRTEFNNGAKYGPLTICFRPASLDAPLTLHWTPDMGFICCQADVRIR